MYTVRGLGGKVRKEAAHREGSFQRDVREVRSGQSERMRGQAKYHGEPGSARRLMEVFPKAYRIDLCRGYCSKSMESAFISLEIQVSFISPNNYNLQFKGEPLWINLLMKAAKKSDNVRVFLTNTWKETFERRYPMLAKFDMHFNEVDSIYDIDSVKLESDGNRRLAYFIDSIDRDFLDFGEKIVAHLAQLSRKNLVVTRIYSDVVSNDGWKSLISIANTTMVLYSDEKERCICSWTHFKKSGDRQSKKEFLTFDNCLNLHCSPYLPSATSEKTIGQMAPTTTFDMGLSLSKAEHIAKESVKLPYLMAQDEKMLAEMDISSNKKIRAGGRIIYTPDERDDFDDSDLDDDLEI
ncbi:unnamed protein product [Dracunculus medinensis]|uniref:Elongator complex protein 5 n=1 Tax=Dracunculus medinensis TaxID=318479 RepID=A0A0N4UAR9_DRAME|nr:unnamed protein product [Dracunculus medinensis]